MRSCSAAALLFALACVTECLAAQSDRSRQRSGPIRSVPVAADIKREVDFDCPEEFGYYPHPTDCTLYYVCVFGGALLESCTGGLMYSHELQTCDWPRNVGCDATGAVIGEDLERLGERNPPPPPPPPPRRTPPPPPPPRAQPNPVVTSRGQPKFNREEYEKQQQLYAEVDDLPPVEEIESDRQQRVYRGQPSTIGQVQKDRDGYVSQVVSSGRNLNSNVIPASIPQNSGKLGSFSFGTQVDDRRAAAVTQAPQSYSEDRSNNVTDSHHDRPLHIITNEIDVSDVPDKPVLRMKRNIGNDVGLNDNNSTDTGDISKRNDQDEIVELFEIVTERTKLDDGDDDEEDVDVSLDDTERGKRQVRYYIKSGYKNPGKHWANSKPIKFVDLQQFNYNPNSQNIRFQQPFKILNNNNYMYSHDSFTTSNPFASHQTEVSQPQRPFKPSLPDPYNKRLPHNPLNVATHIITKSPPISSLKNLENPFSALAGGFYNNVPVQNSNQNTNHYTSQTVSSVNRPNNQISFHDSSLLPSTVVTGKPVSTSTTRVRNNYKPYPEQIKTNDQIQKEQNQIKNINVNQQQPERRPSNNDQDYVEDSNEDENESSEEDSSEKDEDTDDNFNPELPYEYTHPRNKFANIENPFASPDFDFDDFLKKLRDDHYSTARATTPKPKNSQYVILKTVKPSPEITTPSYQPSGLRSSTASYNGISTPRPFSEPSGPGSTISLGQTILNTPTTSRYPQKFEKLIQRPETNVQHIYRQTQHFVKEDKYNRTPQQNHGSLLEAVRPKLKPPNFNDDRQLPISYNFNRPISSTPKQSHILTQTKTETQKIVPVTQKPYLIISSTGAPVVVSTPKQKYFINPEKYVTLQPHSVSTSKPYLVSSVKPHNTYITIKQSTQKPLTTLVNEHLQALQQYWKNPSTPSHLSLQSSIRPSTSPELPKLENLFSQSIRPTVQVPMKNQNIYVNIPKVQIATTSAPPSKRRPIPKPSPEMNDYYYDDDDDQYYYEPPVKSKYMPSSEIRPQRPPMAQNYQEYDDNDNYEELNIKNNHPSTRRPLKYNIYKPDKATKNHNDVSIITKAPYKDFNKKLPVSVTMEIISSTPTILLRPEVSNYEIIHKDPRNKTIHLKKPIHSDSGPYTSKPPKYLNQTTLRPYTIRHRLAKPTTVKEPTTQSEDIKQTRGRIRHHNIVAETKLTTPRDNNNQETRYTKTKHDDKTNSLEPTESVTPSSYSASPRPKMLYNGSHSYNPDQYDPYYAVYDEDGELYKDTDYVQQYNTASLRPAVQQTYRGTPPPRRPVETYTPRPSPDEYDDALIQGQISNQNQYQSPVRHSTRGEGNELGYDHNPSSVRTPIYEATSISTTPSTTSTTTSTTTTTTTTPRPTTAPTTEAMTPSRHTPRSSTDENPIRSPEPSSNLNRSNRSQTSIPSTPSSTINFSSLAKPFEKTDNSRRLMETLHSTERLPTQRRFPNVSNNNKFSLEVVRSNRGNKKGVSLTTGFSIRRNPNNTNNSYTLTVLTRPYDNYEKSRKTNNQRNNKDRRTQSNRYYYDNDSDNRNEYVESKIEKKNNYDEQSFESSMRRKDASSEIIEDDIPSYVRSSGRTKTKTTSSSSSSTISTTSTTSTTTTTTTLKPRILTTPSTTTTTKYYIKSVIRRPSPFSLNNEPNESSTENIIDTDSLIESGLQNARVNKFSSQQSNDSIRENHKREQHDKSSDLWNESVVSPYRTLNNLRNKYVKDDSFQDYPTSTTPPTRSISTSPKEIFNLKVRPEKITTTSKPSYYSYRVVDENIPDQTTEVFSSKVKNVIKAFFNSFDNTPKSKHTDFSSTSPKSTKAYFNSFDNIPTSKHIDLLNTTPKSTKAFFSSFDNTPTPKQIDLSSTTKSTEALFSSFDNTPTPKQIDLSSTTLKSTTQSYDKIVNIGFQKKMLKFDDEKPLRTNVKRLQIITEPTINKFIVPSIDTNSYTEKDNLKKDFSSTTTTTTTTTTSTTLTVPYHLTNPETTPMTKENINTAEYNNKSDNESHVSKFSTFVYNKPDTVFNKPDIEISRKLKKLITEEPPTENIKHDHELDQNVDNELTIQKKSHVEFVKASIESEQYTPTVSTSTTTVANDIASTTSTTKLTTTLKVVPTSTTKSLSFPTRPSRVNPAIKLAATNPGVGRRSYQSSSKCSTDNSLQANPKCNEIKYQRPTSTRGRGSAHYSTSNGSDTPQQQQTPNRGTPPTRSRPTLKPSTAIVSKTTEFVDIYTHPPSRPAPVYPQPTPDKTAAKCRKDVCLLPDCYCGGKDIPGDLPLETVPQIVLLTFDDSVNDLNKGLYADLFEKGRVNPNGCPISATFYVSHEWTDYSQVQNLYSAGHEMASHTVSHSFGEQFSQKKWNREVGGQREILSAYGGVKLEDVRGMRAPFLSVGGNKMFKMLYDSNFTYDSSLPVYENRPPSWPYTLDYKLFHDCMIPPCPTKSYPGVWEVPMVMWQDLNGGRCSMGDACANPPEAEGVYKMILKNFDRHYTTNRAPFGLFYHAAWFTQPHHKEGFIMFLDFINSMKDVWIVTNWQGLQWVRDPTPISRLNNFQPFQCNYQDRPKKCNNPKVCNLWHKSGVRYMRTCQPCPEIYPWTGKTGIKSSRIDNDIEE